MSAAGVELVRRGYRAWNDGDLDAVAELLDPEVTFSGLSNMPDPGPHAGRAEVTRWLEELRETWAQISAGEPELIDAGDGVVAVVTVAGRGMRSGMEIGGGTDVHLWSLREGLVTRLRMLHRGEAISAAGLTEEEWESVLTGTGERTAAGREKLRALCGG